MPKATRSRRSQASTAEESITESSRLSALQEARAQKRVMNIPQASESSQSESSQLPPLAEFIAQKEAQRDVDVLNKMAEAATLQRVNNVRQSMLAPSTVTQYLRYERHWVVCCNRRNYPDTCVIQEKALRYMEENIAEHPDPEKGIEPLRVRAESGKGKQSSALVPPSAETIDMHIKCLVNLFNQQCADPALPMMTAQAHSNPQKYLAVVKTIYENRLARVKGSRDIGSIGLVEGNTSASLRQLMRAAWLRNFVAIGSKCQRKRNSLRDRLDICWLHFMSRVTDLTRVIEQELSNTRSTRDTTDRAVQVLAATTSKHVNACLNDIRNQVQNLRNEHATTQQMVGRVVTKLHKIISDEMSTFLDPQRWTALAQDAIEQDLDVGPFDTDHYMDLDLEAPQASSSCSAPPLVPRAEALPSSLQSEATVTLPLSDESASAERMSGGLRRSPSPLPIPAPSIIENIEMLQSRISATVVPPVKPAEMLVYSMLPRDSSVEELWKEWFYGVNGYPSLLQLNKWYGTAWRRGASKATSNANAVLYLFKKNIVHAVLNSFSQDGDRPLMEREAEALLSIRQRIEGAGSINLFARSLPKKAPKRKPKA
ncbi:hypothetical protein DFQ26_008580 [Actinomortierella ambigua]|nr:hypothetical protein DFQ26_008580 [Actinomortierella ambigua]